MRVVSLQLKGFRRFSRATLNLDAPLMAIVGPNQAGKTSVLAALNALNDKDRWIA
jgi:predicted ATP-dependent endonuclease of OLD family